MNEIYRVKVSGNGFVIMDLSHAGDPDTRLRAIRDRLVHDGMTVVTSRVLSVEKLSSDLGEHLRATLSPLLEEGDCILLVGTDGQTLPVHAIVRQRSD